VRCLYLDESGFSNPEHEPFAIVAGPLVHGDRDMHRAEQALTRLKRKLIPDQPDAILHAMHVWHGSPPWHRNKFSIVDRKGVITAINAICDEFSIPVSMGLVHRQTIAAQNPELKGKTLQKFIYCVAAAQCIHAADVWLRNNVIGPAENAIVIAEDGQQTRENMRELHAFLRSKDCVSALAKAGAPLTQVQQLPLQRIVDTIHFAEKNIRRCCSWLIHAPSRSSGG